jgi:hypothetical protein
MVHCNNIPVQTITPEPVYIPKQLPMYIVDQCAWEAMLIVFDGYIYGENGEYVYREAIKRLVRKGPSALKMQVRHRPFVAARSVIAAYLRSYGWKLKQIATAYGLVDHSSVIHSIQEFHNQMSLPFENDVNKLNAIFHTKLQEAAKSFQ